MAGGAFELKERQGAWYYGAALAYAVGAYAGGLMGLFADGAIARIAATLLLAHGMIVAAYLIHECGHNLVFVRHKDNARLGEFLSWLCGACYGTYEDMRYKHFRHHVDNADVVCFDYEAFFRRHPVFTRVVKALEFVYVPAHDLTMHGVMMLTSFVIPERRNQRRRNVVVIVVRLALFGLLAAISPLAAVLYAVAYMIMIHVLRFMDSLQHDYDYELTLFRPELRPPRRGDVDWEQEHTFSPLLSRRFPWLNLAVLNFGYHNAHHADMQLPFYRLPAKHRELTGDDPARVIPLWPQLLTYHRNRVRRVLNGRVTDYPQGAAYLAAAQGGNAAIGGNAASFLTSF